MRTASTHGINVSKDRMGWVLAGVACLLMTVGLIYVTPHENRSSYFLQLTIAVALGVLVSLLGLVLERRH